MSEVITEGPAVQTEEVSTRFYLVISFIHCITVCITLNNYKLVGKLDKSFQDFISVQFIRATGIQNCLILNMLWADSVDDKLKIFFLLFPENRI